ncbi:MAG: hypothetical protein KAH21_03290 [Spirochaetaceae bacterium]|nr:hypothetical protein [Spirochaetaceae bacterium]
MKKFEVLNWSIGIVLLIALLFTGCSSLEDLFIGELNKDSSGNGGQAAEQEAASEAESDRSSGPTSGPQWNQLMISQAQMAFGFAFSAGGMWAGQVGYKPGEFTKFKWTMEDEESLEIERAYLKELDNGQQWWRVSWGDSEDLWIWETLIDPESSQMLRMRARDTDGNEGEVPVSGETVYMPATELTRESVQGATVDKGKVDVPAGRFQADHVVYMMGSGDSQIEFWLAPQIPGGVVKYQISQKDEGVLWNSELTDFGKKATTILKSY